MSARGALLAPDAARRDPNRAAFYGPTTREHVFEADGYALYLRDVGPEDGAPTLLLHGFPQTGAMYAPLLRAWPTVWSGAPRRFLIPDLPGYGRSVAPAGVAPAAKSAWARLVVGLLDALGAPSVDIVGHDRGGRLGYRLALEHPARVARLAVLDILPTIDYWRRIGDRDFALKIYHWMFLAQPAPSPETMIAAAPEFYIDAKLSAWSASGDLSAYEPAALEEYRENGRRRAAAMCDDYRAGAGPDVDADRADEAAGRRISCPLLVLWGAAGIAGRAADPIPAWRAWASGPVVGEGVEAGHFLPEEAPRETAAALARFLA